jgi:hypothetical protein
VQVFRDGGSVDGSAPTWWITGGDVVRAPPPGVFHVKLARPHDVAGELLPEGEVTIDAETHGPRSGRLRVEGAYPGGCRFVTRITCFSRVSWFLAEHEIVSGDVAQIASVTAESDFNLPAAPLSTAFGARRRADGAATSWAVVTDGVSTVDVATVGAWSDTGSVRYEVGPDGRFRAIFPFEKRPCILYYHFLITPPMDHVHSPAPSMATDPECRII